MFIIQIISLCLIAIGLILFFFPKIVNTVTTVREEDSEKRKKAVRRLSLVFIWSGSIITLIIFIFSLLGIYRGGFTGFPIFIFFPFIFSPSGRSSGK